MAVLETLQGDTGPNPQAAIVVLHGLGADGNDFVPIAQQLDLGPVGPVRFVFPHAPVRPVTINGGYRMRAWYDILGTEERGVQDEKGLREAMGWVRELLDDLRGAGIAPGRTVLMGFSQGCAMSLLTGLRYEHGLAGIAALSGYLPLAETTAAERSPANQRTPIFMAHGLQDNVVVPARGEASREYLHKLGYDVEWHDYPMPHSVSPQELLDLQRWLLKVLAPAA
jgi:phospholipase/carboxylesterase